MRKILVGNLESQAAFDEIELEKLHCKSKQSCSWIRHQLVLIFDATGGVNYISGGDWVVPNQRARA